MSWDEADPATVLGGEGGDGVLVWPVRAKVANRNISEIEWCMEQKGGEEDTSSLPKLIPGAWIVRGLRVVSGGGRMATVG